LGTHKAAPFVAEIEGLVDAIKGDLIALSDRIGQHPELGMQERQASQWHVDALAKAGFAVEYPYAGLTTGFRAEMTGNGPGPTMALLVEYDALPEIGHACGHNLHGVMSTGAAIALAAMRDKWAGKLVVLGSPAEEGAVDNAGGKVVLVEQGAFADIDAAMMVHSSSINGLGGPSLAREAFEIGFKGKPAHAAAIPHLGINALEAAISLFNSVNALRQHLTSDVRIHGIITKGGASPNIVPEYAEVRMYARAADKEYLKSVVAKIRNCAEAAALATGAKMAWRNTAHAYDNMIGNRPLQQVFGESLRELGAVVDESPSRGSGSTDMGNVSHVVPSIHPYVAICDEPIPGHSREFAAATMTPRGHEGLILGAKAIAVTTYKFLMQPELVAAAKAEFGK